LRKRRTALAATLETIIITRAEGSGNENQKAYKKVKTGDETIRYKSSTVLIATPPSSVMLG
jgi:hypothetical protein